MGKYSIGKQIRLKFRPVRMKIKKNFISPGDCEIYNFHIPFKMLAGKKRQLFIRRELEKRHPCFSPRSCVDTKISLKKRRLNVRAAVMERSTLAAYQQKSAKFLFLKEEPLWPVFAKKRPLFAFSLPALALLGLLCRNSLSPSQKESQALNELPSLSAAENLSETEASVGREGVLNLLQKIKACDGRILSLNFDGANCNFSLEGVNPEDVAYDIPCALSYSDGKARFTAVKAFAPAKKLSENGERISFPLDAPAKIRSAFFESSGSVQSQVGGERSFSFSGFVPQEQAQAFLENLSQLKKEFSLVEDSLSISSSSENLLALSFALSAGKNLGSDGIVELLSPFSSVFGKKEKISGQPQVRLARKESVAGEKIGEIVTENGEVVSYFKDRQNGKIFCHTSSMEKSKRRAL